MLEYGLPKNSFEFTKFMIRYSTSSNLLQSYFIDVCREDNDSSVISDWIIGNWDYINLLGEPKAHMMDERQMMKLILPQPFGEYSIDKFYSGDDILWDFVNINLNVGLYQ